MEAMPYAENCPKIGVFYCFNDCLIAPAEYQKTVDTVACTIEVNKALNNPGEHRDLWDNFMIKEYPELTRLYDDDHKNLPRGRVGLYSRNGAIKFLVTLDPCIKGKEDEIKDIYGLSGFSVEFSYGTLNYKCRDCR